MDSAAAASEAVDVDIEQHKVKEEGIFSTFLRRASQAPDNESEGTESGAVPVGPKTTYRASKDSVTIANLFTSIMVLGIGGLNWPQDVKPNDEELSGVSYYVTQIFLRHFPIKGKLSRDTLDAIGLFSIVAAWYSRVSPRLAEYRAAARAQAAAQAPGPRTPTDFESPIPVDDPLSPFYRGPKNANS